jgi:WD40 repeat protein
VLATAARSPACDAAARLRTRARQRIGEGWLDRALRALRRADELCPSTTMGSKVLLARALGELGEFAKAREVLDAAAQRKDLGDDDRKSVEELQRRLAKETTRKPPEGADSMAWETRLAEALRQDESGDHAGAKARLLEVWEATRPRGEVLHAAALATLDAAGSHATAESRRMFDRALHELEATHATRVTLETPDWLGMSQALDYDLSRDGRTIAMASESVITLYDTATLRTRKVLVGHTASVRSVAISPDGKSVASRDYNDVVRLWDAATGKTLYTLPELSAAGKPFPTSSVSEIRFSPDGRAVFSLGGATSLHVWSTATGKLLRAVDVHSGDDTAAVAATDGKRFLTIGQGTVYFRIWDGVTGKLIGSDGETTGERAPQFSSFAFTPDGKYIAGKVDCHDVDIRFWTPAGRVAASDAVPEKVALTYFRDETLHGGNVTVELGAHLIGELGWRSATLHESSTGKPIGVLGMHTRSWGSAIFSSDGAVIVMAETDGKRFAWDRAAGTFVALESGKLKIGSIAVSPDHTLVAAAGDDNDVRMWDTATGRVRWTLRGHTGEAKSVEFSPDGRRLASSAKDGTLRIWRTSTGKLQHLLDLRGSVGALAISPDWKTVAVVRGDSTVRLWDLTTGTVTRDLIGQSSSDLSPVFSPDGSRVAAASYYSDKSVHVWNLVTGQKLWTLAGHDGAVTSLGFSPDGKTLASSSAFGPVLQWDLSKGVLIRKLDGSRVIGFAHNGGVLVLGEGWTSRVALRDAATGALMKKIRANGATIAPDGESLAVAADQLRISSLRGETLVELRALRGSQAAYVFEPGQAIEFLGPGADPARIYPVCRVGTTPYPFALCAGRFELPGFAAAQRSGKSFDELL